MLLGPGRACFRIHFRLIQGCPKPSTLSLKLGQLAPGGSGQAEAPKIVWGLRSTQNYPHVFPN